MVHKCYKDVRVSEGQESENEWRKGINMSTEGQRKCLDTQRVVYVFQGVLGVV